jgi:hypothetical protein
MKVKLSKDIKDDLADQAGQIIYFEAAMSNEDEATKAVLERITEIYKAGYEHGLVSK